MRKILLAAVALSAISSTPALARDGQFYTGIEGGVMWPSGASGDAFVNLNTVQFPATPVSPLTPLGAREIGSAFDYDFNMGWDVDLIGGYDFGMFRLEAELGYKQAKRDDIEIGDDFFGDADFDLGNVDFIDADSDDTDGEISVWSAMANGLVDFGDEDGFSFYAGGGFGWAKVRALNDSDGAWAWQLIAGARYAISPNIDLGLKYRYFSTADVELRGGQAFSRAGAPRAVTVPGPTPPPANVVFLQTTATVSPTIDDNFSSHSLLASVIFNFGAPAEVLPPPPPPPPPPEPAPATQTCPDGSVILATDACPAPPAYVPPPPEPAPERG